MQNHGGSPPDPAPHSREPASRVSGHIWIMAGSIIFSSLVGALFGFNMQAYMNLDLRHLNPQAITGILMYGPELFLGLVILVLSILGMTRSKSHSLALHWATFSLTLLAFVYFACFLQWYIIGLFIDEFPIGLGLVFMLVGSLRNLI